MRLGRHLTVQEVYNIINYYVQNYELSEAQINQVLQNVSGAIGCLAQNLGINSNLAPICYVKCTGQTIPNNAVTDVIWTNELKDNIDLWDSGDPSVFDPAYSGIYTLSCFVQFDSDVNGVRIVKSGGGLYPEQYIVRTALDSNSRNISFGGDHYVDGNDTFKLSVFQTSGGNLDIASAYCLIIRRSITAYVAP